MNAQADPFVRLRADLVAAATRQATARRHRTSRMAIVVTTAALGLLLAGLAAAGALPWQTVSSPATTVLVPSAPTPHVSAVASGDAAAAVAALARPTKAPLPATVHAAFAASAVHFAPVIAARARLLSVAGTTRLFAAPTQSGAVCFVVVDGDSPAGSCTTALSATTPIATVVGQRADGETIVAGVTSDAATHVSVRDRLGTTVCDTRVVDNAFLCATDTSMNDIASFLVTLANGAVVTQSS